MKEKKRQINGVGGRRKTRLRGLSPRANYTDLKTCKKDKCNKRKEKERRERVMKIKGSKKNKGNKRNVTLSIRRSDLLDASSVATQGFPNIIRTEGSLPWSTGPYWSLI
jgi:DNA replicative helicase MCM subunit Mcm2 (Cdc46/Mcm family)